MSRTATENLRLPPLPALPAGVPSYQAELADVVARIARRFDPVRIILFGSRAYGHPRPESDVDLMVVMETPLSPSEQAAQIRQEIGRPFPLDVHVRTPDRIRLGLREHDFFIEDVMRGITVYGGEGLDIMDEDQKEIQPEDELKQATREWLEKAESDVRIARIVFAASTLDDHQVCFHCQQAVEKLLKALLQEREIRFPRSHDLASLAELAEQEAPELANMQGDLDQLSKCAVDPRYPGLDISREQATKALATASAVRSLMLAALNVEAA